MTASPKTSTRGLTPTQKAMIEAVAEAAAQKAVRQTLIGFGLDADDPVKLQEDFAALRTLRKMLESEEYIKDRAHLRQWRVNSERLGGWTMAAFVSSAVAGIIALLLAGYTVLMKGGHHGP